MNTTPAQTAKRQADFMQLYEPVHPRLCRFVQSRIWNRDDVKDIAAETVLIAYENFEKMHTPGAFLYYLFSVANRLMVNRERRKKWKGVWNQEREEKLEDANNPESGLLRYELYKALGHLNERQRTAITLFEISGFSIREIAEIQEMGESGVKSNLKRGRERLTKLLTEKPEKEKRETSFILNLERKPYGK